MQRIKREFREFVILLKSVPSVLFALFILSIFAMNLLANKSINLPVNWLALDCGIIVSWVAFLTMDMLTKHFGPKAATEISVFSLLINLFMCFLFWLVSLIDGVWGESFVEGSESIINGALNNTFGGTWYVVLGSSVAFVASALVNNFLNYGIGKLFKKKPDGFGAYVCRSYISTAIGQFVDNLVFALIVSLNFFNWSITQCFTCAATGMIVELLLELIFVHLGFAVCKKWRKEGVGQKYFDFIENKGDCGL